MKYILIFLISLSYQVFAMGDPTFIPANPSINSEKTPNEKVDRRQEQQEKKQVSKKKQTDLKQSYKNDKGNLWVNQF